jgi:RHS repeat-associated protein
MLTGKGRTLTWTSFDMVSQIALGANTLGFTYDSEHARLKETNSDGSIKYYLNDPISGIMQEKVIGASLAVSWNDYVMKGGEMVALHVTAATPQIRYFHKDHLGSIQVLTNETGAVVERDSYDAWGERRNPTGEDDPLYPSLSLTSQVTRGYTGHEQLDTVGLVHMNGRIYDPVIGKMMSADPTVPNPIDAQAYNRYAYVGNNPLSLTDPTGFYDVDPDHPGQMGHAPDSPQHGESHPQDGSKGGAGDQTSSGQPTARQFAEIDEDMLPHFHVGIGDDLLCACGPGFIPGGGGGVPRAAGAATTTEEEAGALNKSAWGKFVDKYTTRRASGSRLAADANVDPTPPAAISTGRPIGSSPTQNRAAQNLVDQMKAQGYRDIRVNQQQVSANGRRVGINRPDVQGTNPVTGKREYHEFDTTESRRAIDHYDRIKANDPDGDVHLHQVD